MHLVLLLASALATGWSSSGPLGGPMSAVAVTPGNPSVIWAGSAAGVFRSVDGGATWTRIEGPVADVARLVVHPTDADKAWVLSSSQGLWRTTDGGATWSQGKGLTGAITANGLAIDPRHPDVLYAGGGCLAGFEPVFFAGFGLYKSTDGGATWRRLRPASYTIAECTQELAIDPFSPWRLFFEGAYADLPGTLESYDGGETWEEATGVVPSRTVIFDPRYPFTHYGIASYFASFFLVSQDGGFTWSRSATKPPATPRALTIDPERGRLFLGTSNGLYRSGDGGRSWASTNLAADDVASIDFGGAPAAVFAATSRGLSRVGDRGTGAVAQIDILQIATSVIALEIDPSNPDLLYAATLESGRGHLYRSANRGTSWERVPGDDEIDLRSIAVDGGGTLYGGSGSGALYRRARGETKWTFVRGGAVSRVGLLGADPKNAGSVYIAAVGGGFERSRDFGATWKPLGVSASYFAIDPNDPRWLYAAGEDHFYRSADGGDSWVDLQPVEGGLLNGTRGLAIAASNSAILYRVGANNGRPRPERSDDRGVTWRAIGDQYAARIAVDPNDENSVWVSVVEADGAGLYHSADAGAHWATVNGPFGTPLPSTAMRFDPRGGVMHLIYPNHGVWELALDH